MAFKFTILIACFIAAAVALPVDNDVEGERTYVYSEYKLSGASGTFRYPLSGTHYANNERVLITAGFPKDTVFILENYSIETDYDTLNFYKWAGDDLVLDKSYTGHTITPKYFLPKGNFLITLQSDAMVPMGGFNLRWAPLETLKIAGSGIIIPKCWTGDC